MEAPGIYNGDVIVNSIENLDGDNNIELPEKTDAEINFDKAIELQEKIKKLSSSYIFKDDIHYKEEDGSETSIIFGLSNNINRELGYNYDEVINLYIENNNFSGESNKDKKVEISIYKNGRIEVNGANIPDKMKERVFDKLESEIAQCKTYKDKVGNERQIIEKEKEIKEAGEALAMLDTF